MESYESIAIMYGVVHNRKLGTRARPRIRNSRHYSNRISLMDCSLLKNMLSSYANRRVTSDEAIPWSCAATELRT